LGNGKKWWIATGIIYVATRGCNTATCYQMVNINIMQEFAPVVCIFSVGPLNTHFGGLRGPRVAWANLKVIFLMPHNN